jgi:hypothetical protein
MRLVITKSYCLPHDVVKWLDDIAKKKSKSQKRTISTSSVLSDFLVEIKKKKSAIQ